jgi:hypothetical protein
VSPTGEGSAFGYCEKCGVVYFLGTDVGERMKEGDHGSLERTTRSEVDRKGARPSKAAFAEREESPQPSYSRWKCPDCGAEIELTSEGDLMFAKREHIREYHPNRSMD